MPILKTIYRQSGHLREEKTNFSAPRVQEKTSAPEPKPPGSLLSVTEAATIIGVPDDTIRRWARAGKISSIRVSKVDVRFRQVDLDEFIGSRLHHRKSTFRLR